MKFPLQTGTALKQNHTNEKYVFFPTPYDGAEPPAVSLSTKQKKNIFELLRLHFYVYVFIFPNVGT